MAYLIPLGHAIVLHKHNKRIGNDGCHDDELKRGRQCQSGKVPLQQPTVNAIDRIHSFAVERPYLVAVVWLKGVLRIGRQGIVQALALVAIEAAFGIILLSLVAKRDDNVTHKDIEL